MNRRTKKFAAALPIAAAIALATWLPMPGGFQVGGGLVSQALAQDPGAVPVADAGLDRTVALGAQVVLDGSGSRDPQTGKLLSFQWSMAAQPAGSTAALDDAAAIKPSFTADLAGDYVVELVVSREGQASLSDQVVISTANSVPVARAGRDQEVVLGQSLQLDGSGSFDMDGDALSYSWVLAAQPAGSAAALSDAAAVRPSLTIDATGDYRVELTVSDGSQSSAVDALILSTDELKATARTERSLAAEVGEAVVMRPGYFGQKSNDANHSNLIWAQVGRPAGSSAALDDFKPVRPSLTVDQPGTYVVQLEVNGEPGDKQSGTLAIDTNNLPALADAGPDQRVLAGDVVTLDAAGSTDLEGDRLTYRWDLVSAPAGSAAALDDATSVRPSFTVDLAGSYVAQLLVDDGSGELGAADTVAVGTENHPPLADAGEDQVVGKKTTAQLNGTASSDVDSDSLTYHWTMLEAPNGNGAVLSDPTSPTPTFYVHKEGDYLVQLIVSDGSFESLPDTVLITTGNRRPEAIAGADQAIPGTGLVNLDGSASFDANGDDITYFWAILHAPENSTAVLDDPTSATPSFTTDIVGDYVVQLIVDDAIEESLPDTVVISVVNEEPVAVAAADPPVVETGTPVTLDGSGSFDPNNDPLTYLWTLTAAPAGSAATIADPAAAVTSFTPDLVGDYSFRLVVNDGFAASAPATAAMTAVLPSLPPVLDPIGDITVPLGMTLVLPLTASDPNGDVLSFFATPLPLPDGAGLDSASGQFRFRPNEDQIGQFQLTFIVSDGFLTDEETVTVTVPAPNAGGVTQLSGRLLDAVDFADGIETPVVNSTVSFVGQNLFATTGSDGSFIIATATSGGQVLNFDGDSADQPAGGSRYLDARYQVDLIASVTNVPDDPYFLDRHDPALACSPVLAGQAATIANSEIGARLDLQADAAKDPGGVSFEGDICLDEVPRDSIVNLLPPLISPCQLLTVQEFDLIFDPAAEITLANVDALPPGAVVDIWFAPGGTGEWMVAGTGTVSADAASIVSDGPVLTGGGYVFAVPKSPLISFTDDYVPDVWRPSFLRDGNISTALNLPGYIALDSERSVKFLYNSTSAAPSPVLAADLTLLAGASLPNLIESSLQIGGVDVAGPVYTSLLDADGVPLDPDADETIRQALTFDASALPTGNYPYSIQTTLDYGCSKVTVESMGRDTWVNEGDSPYGSGWTIEGLQTIVEQEDGRLVLHEGDGTALTFNPVFVDENIDFPDFSDLARFRINGAAININSSPVVFGGQTVLRMTNALWQASTAILDEPIPLEFEGGALSFRSSLVMQMTNPGGISDSDGKGADGITFIILDGPDIVGGAGGSIGFGGINPSVVVEFDSWRNSWDPNGNHIGVNLNGNVRSVATAPVSPRFNNSAVWYTWIDYIGDTQTLEVRVSTTPARPELPQLTHTVDLAAVLGSDTAFMGFTSGTGAARNDHDLRSWQVEVFNEEFGQLAFATPVSDFSVLVKNPGTGGYTRSMKDGTVFEFDANGRQTAEIDANGNRTEYAYDADGKLLTITDPTGQVTTFVYNADGQLATITDPSGRQTEHIYDPLGRLVEVRNADGTVQTYNYDPESNLIAETSERGFETTYNLGTDSFVDSVNLMDGTSVQTEIAQQLGLADLGIGLGTLENPLPYARSFDGSSIYVDGNGNFTEIVYDAFGQPVKITDPIGRVTSIQRDENGQATSITKTSAGELPDGSVPGFLVTEIEYDDRGNVVVKREAAGTALQREERWEYEPDFNRVTKFIDAAGNETSYLYDAKGNLLQTIVPENGPGAPFEVSTFDARGLELTSTDANGNVTQFLYDAVTGNKTGVIDAELNETRFVRDSAGRITSEIEGFGTPAERTTSTTYDAMNRELTLIDGAGGLTTFVRDESGNVLEERIETGAGTSPIVVTQSFDEMERPVFVFDPRRGEVIRTLDDNGNIIAIENASLVKASVFYDAVNRVEKTTDPFLVDRFFEFDAANNLTAVTDANSNTTAMAYDVFGRKIRHTNPLGETWHFEYDNRNNQTRVIDAKGQSVVTTYDALSRVTKVTMIESDGITVEDEITYSYDNNGNRLTVRDGDSALLYSYDGLNRVLTEETLSEAGTVLPGVILRSEYDSVGNRVSLDHSPDGVVVDGTWNFAYDGAGRLASLLSPSIDPANPIELKYDLAGRAKGVDFPNGVISDVLYDVDSRPQDIAYSKDSSALSSFGYAFDAEGKIVSVDGRPRLERPGLRRLPAIGQRWLRHGADDL